MFVYAALAAPGGSNFIAALRKTKFSQVVRKLPMGKFLIGDNAYVCSATLLTLYSGFEKDEPMRCTQFLYKSIEDLNKAKIWNYDNKMASICEKCWEVIYVHYKIV